MGFMIKGTFWFTLVLVGLSYVGGRTPGETGSENAAGINLADAFTAATGAYDYVTGLCDQKPEVCEKGASTFHAVGVRAREGALVAYQMLDRHFGDGQAETGAAGKDAAGKSAMEKGLTAKGGEPQAQAQSRAQPQAQAEAPLTTRTLPAAARQPFPAGVANGEERVQATLEGPVITGSVAAPVSGPIPTPRPRPAS